MSAKQADGDLVHLLDGRERNLFDRPRGSTPRPGSTVTLWRLDGERGVWSTGPEAGTWWLRAGDVEAQRLVTALTGKPDRGAPVVRRVWRDCIAVRSKEIRPAALRGAR